MQLPTVEFALFFAIVFAASILVRGKRRAFSLLLLLASSIFYFSWDPRYLAIIAAEIGLVYVCLILVHSPRPGRRRLGFAAGCAIVFGAWLTFKHFNFFTASLQGLLDSMGVPASLPFLGLAAPLGISYYSFKLYSQLHDGRSGKEAALPDFLDFANFAMFFPHATAGPVMKPGEFYPRIGKPCDFDAEEVLILLLVGYVKKVVLGSFLYELVADPFAVPGDYAGRDLLFAAIGYTALIYVDFSGYNDLALGVSRLLGFDPPSNFNMPYRSTSLGEFWRRWHVTLGRWLKDYMYIPLGGSRRGAARKYLNLFLTLSFSGLWHGSGLNFIVWGMLHGLGLIADDLLRKAGAKVSGALDGPAGKILKLLGKAAGWLWTISFVILARIFFYSPSMDRALEFWAGLFRPAGSAASIFSPAAVIAVAAVYAMNFFEIPLLARAAAFLKIKSTSFKVVFFVLLFYLALGFAPETVAPFIYFRF